MGVKRLSRGKLFNTEKLGTNVLENIGVSGGMKDAIVSATQHREGFKVVTDIVVDLGTSKTTVKSPGVTENHAVGTLNDSGTAEVSYLCKLDASVFGVVSVVETVCLEAPTDGVLEGANAYKLLAGNAVGKIGGAPGATVAFSTHLTIGTAKGKHDTASVNGGTFTANALDDKYLYIVAGSAAGTTVGAAVGRIAVSADNFNVNQLENGKTRIIVVATDGTVITGTADSSVDRADSGAGLVGNAAKIGIQDVTTAAHLAEAIASGFHAHAKLSAVVENTSEVKFTQVGAGVDGNTAIAVVNGVSAAGAALTLAATVTDFAGGTTAGTSTAMTAGKFLIRVEGFLAPDDL
jgi:hypothetical protein